jgi:glycolate oxidase FAD binding subunit
VAEHGVTSAAPAAHPVAAPRDARDVADRVREAAAARSPLRIVGGGTWLDAGRPVPDAAPLDLAALSGIVEYVPGDLTLTARAGTPLGTIARVTAAERQWLAMDPWGAPGGSIGATIATASAGPLAHLFGTPRDNVLGVEAVTGRADVVRGGGRVVKNVAGFDLVRLFTGAWGTLGALTEVTVRLRALPEVDETVIVELPDAPALVRQLLDGIRRAPLAPWAMELLSEPLAASLGLGDRALLMVRLAGNAALVASQRGTLSMIGATELVPADTWARLREAEPPHGAVVRLSHWPAATPETWAVAVRIARAGDGWAHMTAGRGVARVVLPDVHAPTSALLAALASPFPGTRIYERLPAALWPALAPSAAASRLARGVRAAFDPQRVLNPGILGSES